MEKEDGSFNMALRFFQLLKHSWQNTDALKRTKIYPSLLQGEF